MRILLLHKGYITQNDIINVYKNTLDTILPFKVETLDFTEVPYPNGVKKVPASQKKEWFSYAKETLDTYDLILCSDPDWFKTLAKTTKAEGSLGNILQSPFTKAEVMYIPSHRLYYFNQEKAEEGINFVYHKIKDYIDGTYQQVGADIVHTEVYPQTVPEIKQWLDFLLNQPELDIDIETRSLNVTKAGLYTIAFSWDKHNGLAFPIDAIPEQKEEVRQLLKEFFINYQGIKNVHKANFDVMVLVYNLFMNQDITNIKGKLEGLNYLLNKLDDTLIITYLATNSCAGNTLGLKDLAQPFAGDWAVDVSDVTKTDLNKLLRYNLIDVLSTRYVKETYYPKMVEDNQEQLYKEFMLPVLKDNIRMQLVGLPINLHEVDLFKQNLLDEQEVLINNLNQSIYIHNAEELLSQKATEKRNSKLKTKVTTIEDNKVTFNFSSNNHLQVLVYDIMGLPIIETTPNNDPATGKSVLKSLISHTEIQEFKDILQWLIELADVSKILKAFIPAFQNAHIDKNNNAHLLGYFNLAGTVSGRLSSSQINLQQLPSTGSRFAKPTKKCFKGYDGWIFVGIDFASLEDRISALTTKDLNKLKVYLDNYDGHCLRAYSYFKDKMPDIELAQENEPCYTAKVGNTDICWKASDTIQYQNQTYTGEQFYELVSNT